MSAARRRAIALVSALAALAQACTGGHGKPAPTPSGSTGTIRYVTRLRATEAGWTLPAPTEREVVVASGGTVVLAGGLDSAGASTDGVFTLDPATGALHQVGTMPQPFHDATGAILHGSLFVFGGGSSSSSDAILSFDLASHRSAVAGHLPTKLSDVAGAMVEGTVYLIGGYDDRSPQATVYATSDGTHVRAVAQLPQGLRYAAVAAVGSTLIVAGGETANGPTDQVLAIETSTGRVRSLGRLPTAVGHASAFVLDGKVEVAGGVDAAGHAVRTIWSVDPTGRAVEKAGSLPAAVSDAGTVVVDGHALVLGGDRGGPTTGAFEVRTERVALGGPTPSASPVSDAERRPFAGLLLIADRGNDRLLVMDAHKHIVWRYPDPSLPAPPFRFYFPDDAFFVHHGHAILINEEENHVIAEIGYPSGQTLWTYGTPGVPGSGPNHLDQPDDVYPWPGGGVVVADAKNCRILFFDAAGHVSRQIGRTGNADVPGSCVHHPPGVLGYPNGDTPLAGGGLLISELRGGWLDQVRSDGSVVWATHVPGVTLPSDPQRLADGNFLTVDYQTPGKVVEFTSAGKVLWSFGDPSGSKEVSNPSLAAPLPNGLIAVVDDFAHRVFLVDPATDRIVWSYGHRGVPGTADGYLNTPDGLDLLLPNGTAPLHVDFASPTTAVGRP